MINSLMKEIVRILVILRGTFTPSFFRSFLTIRFILVEAVPVIVTSVGDSIPAPLNEKRPFFRPLKRIEFFAYIPDGKER